MISVQILAFFYVHNTYVRCIETIYLLYRHHTVSLWQTLSVSVWHAHSGGGASREEAGGGGFMNILEPNPAHHPLTHTPDIATLRCRG